MDKSSDRKSAFGLSGDQIGRLLSIGCGDDVPGPSESSLQIEGYEIIEKIAEAGQGQVWRAVQLSTGRQVAIKAPRMGSVSSERALLRFEREIELAARLEHPNIARIYESGVDRGRYYYVMDFITGMNLDKYVRQNKLTNREVLELIRTVCQAVQHAHQNRVIHRDLKPSNIVVTEDGHPYIVDFGLAKAMFEDEQGLSVSMDGETVGTPAYMSPEQAAGDTDRVDTRTDIYSLGVILFNLLTGESPYDLTGSRQQVLRRIADGQVRQPRAVCPGIDRDLEALLLKALDRDPDRRYPTAASLADDIRNYLNGAALIAGPPSRSYRIKKFVKRNRTLVSAVVIAGLTIAIGSIVSLAMYVRAEVQAQRSQAVSSFLNDTVLQALDPTRSQGGEITVLSVLDAVSDALEGRFADAPLIEAEVRHRLGLDYRINDASDRWQRHLRRAVEIRRHELGDDHPMTISSMFELGSGLSDQGYCGEAGPLLLRAVAGRTRQLGEENTQTLYAKTILARNYLYLGQTNVAIRLLRDVLDTARRVGGDENSEAINAMFFIGVASGKQGDYSEAEKWLGRALQLSRRVQGEDHAWTCCFMGWLGWAYMLQGRYDKAETLLTEAIRHEEQVFGAGHFQTVQHMQFLTQVYAAWGRLEEAAKWRAKLIATRSADAGSLSGSILYDEKADTYAIRGSGMDIWDIFDEFHFVHNTLQGDGSITARIDSLENTNPWAKSGVMIRKTLEPTSENASVFITPPGVVTFQGRSSPRGVTSNSAKQVALPHWVRLTRRGNTFTAEHSGDGVTWEEVRSPDPNDSGPAEITMDETVYIGLVVTSHDAGRAADAMISRVTYTGNISPAGPFTQSQDIGLQTLLPPGAMSSPMAAADANDSRPPVQSDTNRLQSIDGELSSDDIEVLTIRHGGSVGGTKYEKATGIYTIVGSGTDIGKKADEFHFAWKRLDGDGSILARIDSVEQTHPWAKAGIMIRNTLDADSARADVILTPTKRISFQYRTVAGSDSSRTRTEEGAVTLPHWVKLTREGDRFTAQHSSDGKKWRDIEGDVPGSATSISIVMNKTVYVGLAVTSHAGPFVAAEAKMCNVTLEGDVSPAGDFLWSEDIGFQAVALPKK